MSLESDWQTTLNPSLMQQVLRPVERPGVIRMEMATAILQRSQALQNRLPLVNHLSQRLQTSQTAAPAVPIVYASSAPPQFSQSPAPSPAPSTHSSKIIQAKFETKGTSKVTLSSPQLPQTQQSNLIYSVAPDSADPSTDLNSSISSQALPLRKNHSLSKFSDYSDQTNSFEAVATPAESSATSIALPLVVQPLQTFAANPDLSPVSSLLNDALEHSQAVPLVRRLPSPVQCSRSPEHSFQIAAAQPVNYADSPQQPMIFALSKESSKESSQPAVSAQNSNRPSSRSPLLTQDLLPPPPQIYPAPPAAPAAPPASAAIDIDSLTRKVERKLMRRLATETERRGIQW